LLLLPPPVPARRALQLRPRRDGRALPRLRTPQRVLAGTPSAARARLLLRNTGTRARSADPPPARVLRAAFRSRMPHAAPDPTRSAEHGERGAGAQAHSRGHGAQRAISGVVAAAAGAVGALKRTRPPVSRRPCLSCFSPPPDGIDLRWRQARELSSYQSYLTLNSANRG